MKSSIKNCFGLALAIAMVATVAAQEAATEKGTASPAKVTSEPAKSPPVAVAADNSQCFVCHINFEEEELAATHRKAGVGCVKCHGPSRAHKEDESNMTPPDIMYAKEKINPACLKCHQPAKLGDIHESVLAGTDPKNKYCTDCHGEHHLNHRTRIWDKNTRKLLPRTAKGQGTKG